MSTESAPLPPLQFLAVHLDRSRVAEWEADERGDLRNPSISPVCTRQHVETWLGCGWVDALHPEDRDAVAAQWRAAFRQGCMLDVEVRLRGPEQGWRRVRVRAMPVRDRSGRIVRWLGMNTDLTERTQPDHEPHDPTAELRLILDALPAAVSYVDREERYRFNNRTYENWFGRSAADVYGKQVREVIGDAGYELLRNDVAAALAGQRRRFERWIPYRDGGLRYVSVDYVPRVLADGSVAGFYALIGDLTESRRAELAVRESEARLRAYVTATSDVVYSMSADWTEMHSLSGKDFLRNTDRPVRGWVETYIPQEERPLVTSMIAEAIRTRRIFDLEHRVVRVDGTIGWVHSRAVPVLDEKGEMKEWVGAASDVTERRQAQEVLRQLQDLRQVQVASHAAAALAHELNQPLTAISSCAAAAIRLVRSGDLPDEQLLEISTMTLEQSQRAGQVLRELLATLNARRSTSERVDLNQAVLAALAVVQNEVLGGFRTVLRLEKDLRPVQANVTDVQNVVANLVRNGVEAMRSAGVADRSITITVRTAEEERLAHLSVTDAGPGIDAATAARIFEAFFTTKRTGVGMGLTISRALIEAHGGRLWVETRPGSGATFHCTLPFCDV